MSRMFGTAAARVCRYGIKAFALTSVQNLTSPHHHSTPLTSNLHVCASPTFSPSSSSSSSSLTRTCAHFLLLLLQISFLFLPHQSYTFMHFLLPPLFYKVQKSSYIVQSTFGLICLVSIIFPEKQSKKSIKVRVHNVLSKEKSVHTERRLFIDA